MSNLQQHIKEIAKTLAPEYGPESPSEAVNRLLEYYQRFDTPDRTAFVAALIGELVTMKTKERALNEEEVTI